jgi:putative FmdB family regulatory protein
MPIYEFKCRECSKVFERICFTGDDESDIACPACEGKGVDRLLSCFSSVSSGSERSQALSSSGCSSGGGFS